MEPQFSGNQIRKTFIDFFIAKAHTYVASSSLVPGGDATLLFTNAGMVQFKDVFLGTDRRALYQGSKFTKMYACSWKA